MEKKTFSRIRGKSFDKALCEFAECVHYKIPKRLKGPELNKWDNGWGNGIFLGVRAISSEIYVGTPDGIVKCRAIRRKVPADRWDRSFLEGFRGLPWDAHPQAAAEPSAEEQLKPLPASDQVVFPRPIENDKQKRDFTTL